VNKAIYLGCCYVRLSTRIPTFRLTERLPLPPQLSSTFLLLFFIILITFSSPPPTCSRLPLFLSSSPAPPQWRTGRWLSELRGVHTHTHMRVHLFLGPSTCPFPSEADRRNKYYSFCRLFLFPFLPFSYFISLSF
jgi:hypothetical protein